MIIKYFILFSSIFILAAINYSLTRALVYRYPKSVRKILSVLNIYIASTTYSNREVQQNELFIKEDFDYCVQSDFYKFYHPDTVLRDQVTLRDERDYAAYLLQRSTFDALFDLKSQEKYADVKPERRFSLDLTYPFATTNWPLTDFSNGVSFMCLFQKSNQFGQKNSDLFASNFLRHFLAYKRKLVRINSSNICQSSADITPKAADLSIKSECLRFLLYLNTNWNPSSSLVSRSQEELVKLNEEQVAYLRTRNASYCSLNLTLLLQEHVDVYAEKFKVFLYIASTNPLIAYFYQKAYNFENDSSALLQDSLKRRVQVHLSHLLASLKPLLAPDSKTSSLFWVDFLLTQNGTLFVVNFRINPKVPRDIYEADPLPLHQLEIMSALLRKRFLRFTALIKRVIHRDVQWSMEVDHLADQLFIDSEDIELSGSNLFELLNYHEILAEEDCKTV